MAFQKLPLELRLKIWETTLEEEGRLLGVYPNRDLIALRPHVPVIARINQESRGVFNQHYIRIRDNAEFHAGPNFELVQGNKEDHVYVNGEIDTLTIGSESFAREMTAAAGLDARGRESLRKVWLTASDVCLDAGYTAYEDLLSCEKRKPVAALPRLLFPKLDTIFISSYDIEYSVKEWDTCFGFQARYHVATGKVFMMEGGDFETSKWMNERRNPPPEGSFNEENSFVMRIDIDRDPSLDFVKKERGWYLLTSENDEEQTASYQAQSSTDAAPDVSTNNTIDADTEPDFDLLEYVDEACTHWRMVWHMVVSFIGYRLTEKKRRVEL